MQCSFAFLFNLTNCSQHLKMSIRAVTKALVGTNWLLNLHNLGIFSLTNSHCYGKAIKRFQFNVLMRLFWTQLNSVSVFLILNHIGL